MKIAAKQVAIDKCPHVKPEAKAALESASRPPIQLVAIGTGDREVKIGNETQLYRHEEKFHRPAAVAVRVADTLDEAALGARAEGIGKLVFERIGAKIRVNLVAVDNASGDPARFEKAARTAAEKSGLPCVLMSAKAASLAKAAAALGPSRPLLYVSDPAEAEAAAKVAKEHRCPLAIRADGLELPLDADEAVRLAEEADKAAPSRGTRSCLISALLSRGGRTLAEQDATYKAWTSKARRALGHRFLVALALSESGKLRERALANADVRRAVDLVRQEAQAFPDEPSVWAWAMLKEPHPKDAALVAKALAGDDRGRLLQQLAQQVAPLNAPAVLNDYWLQRLAGNEAEARAVLQQAAQRGIPLPFDGKQ